MQNNDALQVQLRKNQDTLKIVGLGVIAFGAWSVVKTVLYSMLQWNTISGNWNGYEENKTLAVTVYVILLIFFLGIDITVRLLIGRAAIAEGRGKKKGFGYIVAAFLIAVLSLTMLALGFLMPGQTYGSPIDVVIAVIVELTSGITLLEMCFSALRVRKLCRQLAEQR